MDEILTVAGLGVIILAGVVLAVKERRKAATYQVGQPARESTQRAMSGRPDYEAAHAPEIAIYNACELAEARRSGRRLGGEVVVTWQPGRDYEVDKIMVPWLRKHGRQNGVFVREVHR